MQLNPNELTALTDAYGHAAAQNVANYFKHLPDEMFVRWLPKVDRTATLRSIDARGEAAGFLLGLECFLRLQGHSMIDASMIRTRLKYTLPHMAFAATVSTPAEPCFNGPDWDGL